MNFDLPRLALLAVSLLLVPTLAKAQVNGPGPSDPALFDTVLNLPDDQIFFVDSIGNASGDAVPTIQFNVREGGFVGGDFDAYSGSEVNIIGGVVDAFDAFSGSEVNISSGTLRSDFNARSGSVVNIRGGTVGDDFDALSGSDVELIGGEFLLNGDAFTGSSITLGDGDLFTGTLEDGSAFAFSPTEGDRLSEVRLTTGALPMFDTTHRVVSTDISAEPSGMRSGQSLTLQEGGVLGENFAAVDATLNIEGGTVGEAVSYTHLTLPTILLV